MNNPKDDIYSELNAIVKLYKFSPKEAYEFFIDDFYNCFHVIDYKLKYAKEWLYERTRS